MIRWPPLLPMSVMLLAAAPAITSAQGAGSAGAATLTLTPGTRAAAFAGAYTAVTGDPDGIFYNPAAVAGLDRGVGLGYEEYVEDVVLGYLAGGLRVGPLSAGAGIVYLDAGEIDVIVPDPRYGGERGRPTGETAGATETAARVAVALRFLDDRASAGVAVGLLTSELAGVGRRQLFVDLGTQYRHGDLSLGAALRNLDTGLSHNEPGDIGEIPLPLEARVGATYGVPFTDRFGALVSTDLVLGLEEETVGLAVGGEAGLLPANGAATAVLRAGATLGEGDHLGRIRVGGGVGIHGLSVDYAVQRFEYLGIIHRIGMRWAR